MFLRQLAFAALASVSLSTVAAPQSADEKAVLAVVQRMFDGMRNADSAMVRSVFAPGARFAGIDERNRPASIKYDTVGGWINAIANSNRRWDEQIYDVQVRVDGNLAQVWAGYTFYLDNKVRHCGIDAVDLLKDASGWKIVQLGDTRRTENCRDVLGTGFAAPPKPPSATTTSNGTTTVRRDTTLARGYTRADVAFIQGMIAHHAQALVMTDLLRTRTTRNDMRLLGERITVSQNDEIAFMQRWLKSRGEEVPPADAHFHMATGHMTPMPGMLTDAELSQLTKATGTEFDKLFLQYMIRHHQGALTMVANLAAARGAVQEPEIFRFASDVDADQRAEIDRMQTLQREIR